MTGLKAEQPTPVPPRRVAAFDDDGAYVWDTEHPDQFTVAIRFIPGSYSEVGILEDGCYHCRAIPTTHLEPQFEAMSLYLALRYGAQRIGYLPEVVDVH